MKEVYIDMFARLFIVVGSLVFSIVNMFAYKIPKMYNTIFSIMVGISALILIFNRDYYLPFLGKCVFPNKSNNGSVSLDKKTKVKLDKLPPNVNVVYWASKPNANGVDSVFEDYVQAYQGTPNSGVQKTNEKGETTVELLCPSEYKVTKFGIQFLSKKIPRHVHYRYQLPKYEGMYSKVFTKKIEQC